MKGVGRGRHAASQRGIGRQSMGPEIGSLWGSTASPNLCRCPARAAQAGSRRKMMGAVHQRRRPWYLQEGLVSLVSQSPLRALKAVFQEVQLESAELPHAERQKALRCVHSIAVCHENLLHALCAMLLYYHDVVMAAPEGLWRTQWVQKGSCLQGAAAADLVQLQT